MATKPEARRRQRPRVKLSDLPGMADADVTAVAVTSVTEASDYLRAGLFITASHDDLRLTVYRDEFANWRCDARRGGQVIEHSTWRHLAAAAQWIKNWWPKPRRARKDGTPRLPTSEGQPTNWHLNLKNVGRCPTCGARCELPCRKCSHPKLKG